MNRGRPRRYARAVRAMALVDMGENIGTVGATAMLFAHEAIGGVQGALRCVDRVEPPAADERAADHQGRRHQTEPRCPQKRETDAHHEGGERRGGLLCPATQQPPYERRQPYVVWLPARSHPRSLRPPARRFQTCSPPKRVRCVEKSLHGLPYAARRRTGRCAIARVIAHECAWIARGSPCL